jgi:hypothetical protein
MTMVSLSSPAKDGNEEGWELGWLEGSLVGTDEGWVDGCDDGMLVGADCAVARSA